MKFDVRLERASVGDCSAHTIPYNQASDLLDGALWTSDSGIIARLLDGALGAPDAWIVARLHFVWSVGGLIGVKRVLKSL